MTGNKRQPPNDLNQSRSARPLAKRMGTSDWVISPNLPNYFGHKSSFFDFWNRQGLATLKRLQRVSESAMMCFEHRTLNPANSPCPSNLR